MTWRTLVVDWLTKATDTHSQYVILLALPLQKWLQERAKVLRYTYIACLVYSIKLQNSLDDEL